MKTAAKEALTKVGQAAKSMAPGTMAKMMDTLNVSRSPELIPEKPINGAKLSSLGGIMGNLLKTVGPSLVSLIPGVGPIASSLLSTMNDDEWFAGYKSSGASYNDLLVSQVILGSASPTIAGTPAVIRLRGAFARYICDIHHGTSTAFTDNFIPSMLAYIRSKTSNVLVSDTDAYKNVFESATHLYAIYYILCKYITFAEHLPVNIPVPTAKLTLIQPSSYSQVVGIRDALKQYLQSTVTLPYAWAQYLRWRFGTAFYSANTGKPGYIFYDYYVYDGGEITGDITVDTLTAVITLLQTSLAAQSRAAADYQLAYANHVIQWDVELPHYDEKEFNLRTNLAVIGEPFFGIANENWIIMDSRLDNNAATQAITISTPVTVDGGSGSWASSNLTPIHVRDLYIDHYVKRHASLPSGNGTSLVVNKIFGQAVGWTGGWLTQGLAENISTWTQIQCTDGAVNYSNSVVDAKATAELNSFFQDEIRAPLMTSLEIHQGGKFRSAAIKYTNAKDGVVNGTYFVVFSLDSISYDIASISNEQIESLNRTAMRNLTRGDYANKSASTEDVKAVKSAAVDIVDTLVPPAK